ncbi:hypothetical protein ElyMa_002806400 [Elysia marginata]|uniref:SUN domain-containing protein n=1 Tax=Elysia marginata TaxID=1093978 RepID=A0AAV4HQK7_9GAST|nr:hypothetical protein ElyMa_002806400 [Elysia marginata]
MAGLVFHAFENETYEFGEGGHTLDEFKNRNYRMTNNTDLVDSANEKRQHAHDQSSNSLAPLLASGSPEPDFSAGFETNIMPQSGNISVQGSLKSNGGFSPPPLPHTKSQPRVFSKKGKGVPIPDPRARGALDMSRSSDSEGWEMSVQESVDSGLRGESLGSPTSPPDWCLPGHFDLDESQEVQSCSYLKPIDSPTPTQLGMFSFTENNAGSPTSPSSESTFPFQDRGESGRSRRFDSGIGGGEFEQGGSRRTRTTSDAPSSTSASSSYPRLSRLATHPEQHYEDIDAYRKYVQPDKSDLAETRRPANGVLSREGSHMPKMNISGVTNAESQDHVIATRIQQIVYIDSKTLLQNTTKCISNHKVHIDEHESSSIPASGFGNNTGSVKSLDGLEKRIADLQKNLENLEKENSNLKADLEKIKGDVRGEVQPLYKEVAHLRITQRDTVQSITEMDDRLTSGIANISLTPGPQGPVGLADFSTCIFQSIAQHAVASDGEPTNSPYVPLAGTIEDPVVIFAYCSMSGAQTKQLDVSAGKGGGPSNRPIPELRYRCVCRGTVTGQSNTKCQVNAIVCPKLQRDNIP